MDELIWLIKEHEPKKKYFEKCGGIHIILLFILKHPHA